ncbi:MAG: hypothetical protein Q9219_004389 [cf. Caloplaca sp. 3 TL-2023]
MDDLTGLNWSSSNLRDVKQKPPPTSQSSFSFPLRPTPPTSGRSTPLTAAQNKPSSNGISRSNASTPANDSFANLVAFSAANPSKNLSLLEQQKKLEEERARQQQRQDKTQLARQDQDFWEKLGSDTSPPKPVTAPPTYTATEDYGSRKLSATINKPFAGIDTSQRPSAHKVSNGSDLLFDLKVVHGRRTSGGEHEASRPNDIGIKTNKGPAQDSKSGDHSHTMEDDDDPFGLGSLAPNSRPTLSTTPEITNDNDDILGLLGRPVSEFPRPSVQELSSASKIDINGNHNANASLADQALAELVDMGFSPEKSKQALETTTSGTDVQAAVGWLLNQAHQETRSRSRANEPSDRRQVQPTRRSPPPDRGLAAERAQPAWMRQSAAGSGYQSRQSSRSPVNGEKDASKVAAELGSNLFKTANSLWKTGTKKLNQAVAELNSDSDSSQPRWMREPRLTKDEVVKEPRPSQDTVTNGRRRAVDSRRPAAESEPQVTDEALMLESADARPPPRKSTRTKPEPETNPEILTSKSEFTNTQAYPRDISQPRFMQQSKPNARQDPRSRISKQAIEEQTAEAYISPARRKRVVPKDPVPEPDLLFESSQIQPSTTSQPTATRSRPKPKPQLPPQQITRPPKPPQPEPPKRATPPISPSALRTSHTSRQLGTAAFKRGDYAEATTHYTSALAPLPANHPLTIPVLTSRALSHLKTGDPKACIADTNATLELIGPSRGVRETVDLSDEGAKDMHGYWGEAMTRQAEAWEQLEKWAEAAAKWKSCVEAGVGGGTSIEGRNRCERAARGQSSTSKPVSTKSATAPKRPPAKPQLKLSSALQDLSTSGTNQSIDNNSEAVARLRAANLAASRLEEEQFALSDAVADRLARWRFGKENNLRALLASLDTVLWEGSGWRKVGMGELILPGKVKGAYVRGIGKVHPDKKREDGKANVCSFCFFGGDIVTDHGHYRAEDDQRGGVCDVE